MTKDATGKAHMRLDEPLPLRDRIIAHLQKVDRDSISGVARAVSEGRAKPIHRLTVAGYLEALTDQGLLREVHDPPSKAYALANPENHQGLHRWLGRIARETVQGDRTPLLAAALHAVLGRPLFAAELKAAGATVPHESLERVVMDDAERRRTLAALARGGPGAVEVPKRDAVYRPKATVDPDRLRALLDATLAAATGATHLRASEERGIQVHLEMEEP